MKFIKWLLGIVGGLIVTSIYEKITEKPLFSILKKSIKVIWDGIKRVLDFETKLVWLVSIIIVSYIVYLIVLSLRKQKIQEVTKNPIFDYNKDRIKGYDWKWKVVKNYDRLGISELTMQCPICKTSMKYQFYLNHEYQCPRCDKSIYGKPNPKDIKLIIIDNWNNRR